MPAVEMSREAARQAQCKNNLKQLGIALQNYHALHDRFPEGSKIKIPDQCDDEHGFGCRGTGLFVLLLPYLEQENAHDYYQQFGDHQYGWLNLVIEDAESPEVPVYICPSEGRWHKFGDRRHYFGVVGGKTLLARGGRGDVYVDGMFGINHWTSHAKITDGSSNTFAIGESSHGAIFGIGSPKRVGDPKGRPVHWWHGGGCGANETGDDCEPRTQSYGRFLRSTKYEPNLSLVPMKPDQSNDVPFSSKHPGITQFLFADGHVSVIDDYIDIEVYQALSTADGQELVDY